MKIERSKEWWAAKAALEGDLPIGAGRLKKGRGGKRKGAGRPKSGDPSRTVKVMVRFTEDERAAIEAVRGGELISTWIRKAAVNAAKVPGS